MPGGRQRMPQTTRTRSQRTIPSLVIDLPPDVEQQLRERAAARGLSVTGYAKAALAELARLAAIDEAYGALADLPFTVDGFLCEKHEEALREQERDRRYLEQGTG